METIDKSKLLKLLAAKKDISNFLYINDGKLKELRAGIKPPAVDDILDFAEKLTHSSYAPKGWIPNVGMPLFPSQGRLPVPQDDHALS